MLTVKRVVVVCAALAVVFGAYATGRAAAGQGTSGKTFVSPGGTQLKVLVDSASLGGSEVDNCND